MPYDYFEIRKFERLIVRIALGLDADTREAVATYGPASVLRSVYGTLEARDRELFLIGLGGALFQPLAEAAGNAAVGGLKGAILLAGFLWSAHIGRRILVRQGVSRGGAALALVPGLIGSALVALAWWPAVVGL